MRNAMHMFAIHFKEEVKRQNISFKSINQCDGSYVGVVQTINLARQIERKNSFNFKECINERV